MLKVLQLLYGNSSISVMSFSEPVCTLFIIAAKERRELRFALRHIVTASVTISNEGLSVF